MRFLKVQNDPFIDSMCFVWTIDSCNGLICLGLDRITSFSTHLTAYENKLSVLSASLSGDSKSCLVHLGVMEEGGGTDRERWSWTKKYTTNPLSRHGFNAKDYLEE
ncbi:uncharacterized protein LOC129295302 [Prosopis cineraria]|uniref:uncharacterized protein LOC129295302 n=1 Tax=Prosopis cineraria TaxID=364024 RepID=UPI0024102DEA|nr:uncharacterized protein LOC129295302 [Prosopis cineraria]